ncbi:hypothetical protein FBU30_006708 [Linnemannia zychae]|nr:hypothetical protein FBU30_006708 [Linnemannia zychae]
MKIQYFSLLLVSSVALARPTPPTSNMGLDRRTLIGDEFAVNNQVDNSQGKRVFRVDHVGDSSIHKGLLYDLVDGPSLAYSKDNDNGFDFRRRSLLSNLFGGDSMTISNENDNSKNTMTKNEHGNHYTQITRVHKNQQISNDDDDDEDNGMISDEFFDKRAIVPNDSDASNSELDRRGLLWGGDSTTINNVNDNSKHTQTMNVHHNQDIFITKLHKSQSTSQRPRRRQPHRGDTAIPKDFFDRRSANDNNTPKQMDRRSLLGDLFGGGKSMSINNVNDNSQTKKTLNSYGNRNTQLTRIHKSTRQRNTPYKTDSFFDKRGLLFGGDSTVINNVNDNSQTKKTLNSHGNRNTRLTRVYQKTNRSGSGFFDKRSLPIKNDEVMAVVATQDVEVVSADHNVQEKREVEEEKNLRLVEDAF